MLVEHARELNHQDINASLIHVIKRDRFFLMMVLAKIVNLTMFQNLLKVQPANVEEFAN